MKYNPFQQTAFIKSATAPKHYCLDTGIEIAFAGRSNAGKSSAINCLTGQQKLAKTSKTPGRTQLINFFEVAEDKRLVDLPGYGYAQVSRDVQSKWQGMMATYFKSRQSLAGVVLIMDCRHPLKPFDLQMLEFTANNNLPVHVLLTKADKLSNGAAKNQQLAVQKELQQSGLEATVQTFSALKRTGLEQAINHLAAWLALS